MGCCPFFYEQFANSTDGIAFSMTLMHTEQDWKKLDIEKNPEKNIFTRSRKFGNKINAQVKRTPHAKFIIQKFNPYGRGNHQ